MVCSQGAASLMSSERRFQLSCALLLAAAQLAAAGWVELAPAQQGGGLTLELQRVSGGNPVSIESVIAAQAGSSLVVLGTYPADFNMIEYAQKVKHYLPQLKQHGVTKTVVVINGEQKAGSRFAELLSMPGELELLADPSGECGRRMGVSRGLLPDAAALSPYVKLFGMLIGVGPLKTLPAILTGYIGARHAVSPRIEDSPQTLRRFLACNGASSPDPAAHFSLKWGILPIPCGTF